MARKKKGSENTVWDGVLGERGTVEWMREELAREPFLDEAFAPEEAKPVSVRLVPGTIAMLDAFAERLLVTRSGMLLRLVEGGLAEAFHALPGHEQERLLGAAKAKAELAGWRVRYERA